MLRPSFVPPPAIRRLRDLTRYRADLVAGRTAEKQRVEQAAGGRPDQALGGRQRQLRVSGRAMLAALVAGERDPKVLAQLARTRLRAKRGCWRRQPVGRFGDHHAFLLATMRGRIDQTSADIAALEVHIEAEIAPFAAAADRLAELGGVAAPPRR
jgi:transposase